MKRQKPIWIQDNFGDFYLACPKCKKPITTPFGFDSEEDEYTCIYCGTLIDRWTNW